MEDNEVKKKLVCKPRVILTSITVTNLPFEIQDMLNEYSDIVVDDFSNELPRMRSISHHIDLILGTSLPNKVAYKMTPQENEEI